MEIRFDSAMPVSRQELFDWHRRPGAFVRLAPPWKTVRLLHFDGTLENGSRAVIEIGPRPFAMRWVAVHYDYEPPRQFCDMQVRGPFKHWRHVHRFEPIDGASSRLGDRIDYSLPGGPLGRLAHRLFVRRDLEAMFRYRHRVARDDLERHNRYFKEAQPMRIVIAGASGLVGTQLAAFLSTGGHEIVRLVRRAAGAGEIAWDPVAGTIDAAALEGADAVIHLGGADIAGGRWTPDRKRAIRDSRVGSTALLAETLAGLERKPRVFICASAMGYYGDRGGETLDETSAPGSGFLSETCVAWEAAADPARTAGVRTAHLRLSVVLSPQGGALKKMLPAFKLGVAGPLGSGRQFMSWIHLDDVIFAIGHILTNREVSGPVNLTAGAATNKEFTRALGRVLRRPAVIPVPAVALRLALGEMADELLLASARIEPCVLKRTGFGFRFTHLERALADLLGRG